MPINQNKFIVLLMLGILVACQPEPEDIQNKERSIQSSSEVLYYFTWSDYVEEALLKGFEQQTGTKVIVDTFSSNEELLAKVQSGATGYDVVVPSDFMVTIMAREGLLAKLDLVHIPNAKLIEPFLKKLPSDFQRKYAVPYFWGTVGIGYDSEVIPVPPKSWEILWDPQYKGRISMLNDQREVFGMALRSMGYSLNSRDPEIIEEAKQKLIIQKPLVKSYTSDLFDRMLVSGDVVLAHAWGGPVARAMKERSTIRYVVPQEGGTVWTDCLTILKTSKRKSTGMAFINYLLDTEVAVRASNRLFFASANHLVKDRLDHSVRQNHAVYPPDDVWERMEWMRDAGEAMRYFDRAWTELKAH